MGETQIDHRLDDRHLAWKVVIEVPRTDPGLMADVGRAGAAEAVPGEATDRRAEDLAALLLMLDGVDFPQPDTSIHTPPRLARRFATIKSKIREFHLFILTDVAVRDSNY